MENASPPVFPEANYCHQELKEYSDNPLISALPPILSPKEAVNLLKRSPDFDERERNLGGHIRSHAIARISTSFFYPMSKHIVLERKISRMIRQGYIGRNPNNTCYKKHLNNGYERIVKKDLNADLYADVKSTASSMTLFGVSGTGKTSAFEKILSQYPPGIYHPEYHIIQIPWIRVESPHDGTLTEFCLQFFVEVDRRLKTNYYKKYGGSRKGIAYLITSVAQVVNLHCIGLLVVDEFQHINLAKGGGEKKMINFLVTLINTIGVPIVLIGTPKALSLFSKEFRSARRSVGEGNISWDRLERDAHWEAFVDELWKYQWLRASRPPTDEVRDKIYELSQGVMDIVIKLFCLSQARAILLKGEEFVSAGLLQQVYDDEFKPVHKMLEALRSRDPNEIFKYGDLAVPSLERLLVGAFDHLIRSETKQKEREDNSQIESAEKLGKAIDILTRTGVAEDVVRPLVKDLLNKHPDYPVMDIVHGALTAIKGEPKRNPPKQKPAKVDPKSWAQLDEDDLRGIFARKTGSAYSALQENEVITDINMCRRA